MNRSFAERMGWTWSVFVVPVAVYLAGFAVFSYPAFLSYSTELFGDGGDGLQNAWNLWWVRKAVVELRVSPWSTPYLYHPDGVTLLGHTLNPFNGFLGIPLAWFLQPVQVYNTIVAFSFVASGYTCFLLCRAVAGSHLGSLFAGFAFTFSSYHWAHADGHMQSLSIEWVALFLLMWVRWLDKPGLTRAALAAFMLLLVLLCDSYYTLYCAIAGAWLFTWTTVREPVAAIVGRLRALAVFVALVLVTCGPLVASLLLQNHRDPFADAHDPLEYSLDLLSLFIPGGHWYFGEGTRWFWDRIPGGLPENSVYLGWTLILPALCAFDRRLRGQGRDVRVWAWLALLFFALALGPQLQVFGIKHPLVPMPYRLLEACFPPLRLSGCPIRMSSMVLLATAVLAAHGFDTFLRWLMTRTARLLFLAWLMLDLWPTPIPLTRPDFPDYVLALARLPPGAVHGFEESAGYTLHFQTVFDKPMTLGYVSRRPQSLVGRGEDLGRLMAEGRYVELIETYRVRYLVAENPGPGVGPPAGLKPVFTGASHTIYVLEADPIGAAR